jgi:hypothetical protein
LRLPAIDRRAPAAGILRDERGDVDLARFGDEVLGIEALVSAQRDRLQPIGVRLDQGHGRERRVDDAADHPRRMIRTDPPLEVHGAEQRASHRVVPAHRHPIPHRHQPTKSRLPPRRQPRFPAACHGSQIRLSANAMGAGIRRHWCIENRSDRVRDVAFGEDQSRMGTKPAHFARLGSFALNILRADGSANVSKELLLNAINPDQALSWQPA